MHLEEGGEGIDFLGFHHRWVRSRRFRHIQYLIRVSSRRAMQGARDRIRELTARSRLLVPTERVVQDVDRFLRGWAGYFRYGNVAREFGKFRWYAALRLFLWWAKRQRWRHRWRTDRHSIADRLSLLTLDGWVVAPRPHRPWRARSNAVR